MTRKAPEDDFGDADDLILRIAGHGAPRMIASVGIGQCGEIQDGIYLRFAGTAGFCVDLSDLDRVVQAAKIARLREQARAEKAAKR